MDDHRRLDALDRAALAELWTSTFGCPAPKNSQASLLCRLIAWQLQMNQAGRMDGGAGLGRQLRRAQAGASSNSLSPGTRLVREWQGRSHHVTVLDRGFEHEGVRYRSLSAVARAITGTPWSGPVFFGLRA